MAVIHAPAEEKVPGKFRFPPPPEKIRGKKEGKEEQRGKRRTARKQREIVS